MKRISLVVLVAFLVLPLSLLQAQSVDDYIEDIMNQAAGFQEDYIKGYVQPFSTSLGTALGGSLYHRGYTKGFPRFDVGISAVYVPIPDGGKEFKSPIDDVDEPTLFGGNGRVDGIKQDFFSLPMLHANVGLFANLEVTARFAALNVTDIGDLVIYGAGLKYGLSELLPLDDILPVDFSAQAAYHKFTLGDILDAGTLSMNLQASASIPVLPIDIYGGIGFDNSSLIVKTGSLNLPTDVGEVTIDGENQLRYNLGISLTILLLNIHADYNIGEYNSIGAGVMLVL